MWSPKLRTQLSSAWIPDPGKRWDNKCVLFQAVKYVICYMAIEECRLLQENLRACDTELLGPEAQGFLGWLLLFPSRSEVLLGWAPGSGDEESWAFSLPQQVASPLSLQGTRVLAHWQWGFPLPPTYPGCLVSSVCSPSHQLVCLLPEWVWTCHSGMIQKTSWHRAGERSICSMDGWAWPFCRLIWSSCLGRWGSGLSFPWGPLHPPPSWEASDDLGSRMRGEVHAEPWWGITEGLGWGCLTSILSLAPSFCFPLIWATLCRAFRVRSRWGPGSPRRSARGQTLRGTCRWGLGVAWI